MNKKEQIEMLDAFVETVDGNDPDAITLQLARSIVVNSQNIDKISSADRDILEEATAIIEKKVQSTRLNKISSWCDEIESEKPARLVQPQRVVHEHHYPVQNSLTMWLMWLIIPFVVTFLFVSGILMH